MRRRPMIKGTVVAGLAAFSLVMQSAWADGPVTNIYVGPVTNNATLNWLWTTQYQFRAETPVHGSVDGTAEDWYDSGTEVNLEATADPHYLFSEWQNVPGGQSDSNPVSFFLTAPYTNVLAVFTTKVYSVTVSTEYGTAAPGSTNVSAFEYSVQSITPEIVETAPGTRVRLSGYAVEGAESSTNAP